MRWSRQTFATVLTPAADCRATPAPLPQVAAHETTIVDHEISNTKLSVEIQELKGTISAGDEKIRLSEALCQQKEKQIDTCVASTKGGQTSPPNRHSS